jgi:phosphoserine phosphatase
VLRISAPPLANAPRQAPPRVAFVEVGGVLVVNDYVRDIYEAVGIDRNTPVTADGSHVSLVASALAGHTPAVLDSALVRLRYRAGARELMRMFRRLGISTVIVSSGLRFVSARVARDLGIDEVFANGLRVDRATGRFTGEFSGDRVAMVDKSQVMMAYLQRHGMDVAEAAAIGNGPLFKDMCTAARHNYAVIADESGLASYAGHAVVTEGPSRAGGWINGFVQRGQSLTSIVKMMGYTGDEIAPVMTVEED